MLSSFKPLSRVFIVIYGLFGIAMQAAGGTVHRNLTKYTQARGGFLLPPLNPSFRVSQLPPINPFFAFSRKNKQALMFVMAKGFVNTHGTDLNGDACFKHLRKQYIP